ncbi:MAG: hypothetical protein AAF220_10955 [Pseudomonadota bacterium]
MGLPQIHQQNDHYWAVLLSGGGRMNQVPDGSNSSLPVDVTAEPAGLGMIVCDDPEAMLRRLAHDQTDTRTEIQ